MNKDQGIEEEIKALNFLCDTEGRTTEERGAGELIVRVLYSIQCLRDENDIMSRWIGLPTYCPQCRGHVCHSFHEELDHTSSRTLSRTISRISCCEHDCDYCIERGTRKEAYLELFSDCEEWAKEHRASHSMSRV